MMQSRPTATSNSGSYRARDAGEEQKPQAAAAADSNSSGLKPSCVRCANYLTEALTSATATADGPVRSLLDAMGATTSLVRATSNNDGNGNAAAVEAVITVPNMVAESNTSVTAEADHRKPAIQHIDTSSESQNQTILGNIRRRLTGAGSSMAPQHAPMMGGAGSGMAVATSAVRDAAQPNLDEDGTADDGNGNSDGSISVSISCQQCSSTGPEGGARAYVRGPHPLSVVLCSNRLHNPAEVQEVLVHELIHIYDMHSRGLDFHDCHQLAYSEVRAARDAECRGSLNRFTMSYCVKERAGHATNNMFPNQEGRNCVGRVLETALADRSPFQKGVPDLPDFTKYCSPK